MSDLLKYLKNEPLNEELRRLKESEDELSDFEPEIEPAEDLVDGDDREHIRRLMLEPGWQVLLKLLDSEIKRQEDAAKRFSLQHPHEDLSSVWAPVAYQQKARDKILWLAEEEVKKLTAAKAKKKKCDSGIPKMEAESL